MLFPKDSTVLTAEKVCVWCELLSLVWGDVGVHGRMCGYMQIAWSLLKGGLSDFLGCWGPWQSGKLDLHSYSGMPVWYIYLSLTVNHLKSVYYLNHTTVLWSIFSM